MCLPFVTQRLKIAGCRACSDRMWAPYGFLRPSSLVWCPKIDCSSIWSLCLLVRVDTENKWETKSYKSALDCGCRLSTDLSGAKMKSRIHVWTYCSAACILSWCLAPPKLNASNDIVAVVPAADYPVRKELFVYCDIRRCYRVVGVGML